MTFNNVVIKAHLLKRFGLPEDASDQTISNAMGDAILGGDHTITDEVIAIGRGTAPLTNTQGSVKNMSGLSTKDILNSGKGGTHIRVKPESEKYLNTKSVGTHRKMGTPVVDERGQEAMTPSDLEKAKCGVYFKKLAAKQGKSVVLSEHEQGLWNEIVENDDWTGDFNGEFHKTITPSMTKALLSDSTSGGVYANPTWFDANAVHAPLLTGELVPLVTIQEMPRGSIAEVPVIGPISAIWGTASGTAASLFDTDALITEIEHAIHSITACLEVGDDMLRDTPLALGSLILTMIGERFAAELDKVIAVGNGTTQPEGLTVASGLTSAGSPVNTTTGPPAILDYESLLFSIGKQYRANNNNCAFLTNDTSYRRSRAIQNDPAVTSTDQRRVFGMMHENYETLGRPHKVQNDLPNGTGIFGNFKYYRLRRRAGMEVKVIADTDWQLARENKQGFLVRARYGGGCVLGAAFSKYTNGQS